ncbi:MULTISPECIES: alpha-keto acid decarboxylase family protein [Amycolatopsis]|uniref:alpha-keto acid decarboxylase family protein n=1 Tax=Amycolatopsis TaxID=1813 RepID=UPI0031FA1075
MSTEPTVSVAAYLAARLRQLGVEHLFGLPGDFNLALLDALLDGTGLTWVGSTNELNAAYAADGYARVRGFGALVTTYGVGELSAINGVAGSFAESVPLVQITGAPATTAARAGSLTHHTLADGDFGHFARAYAEVTAAAEVLTEQHAADQIDRVLAAALRESQPGYLSVPVDVATARVSAARLEIPLRRPESDSQALAAFTAALGEHLRGAQLTLLAGHLARRRDLGQVLRRIADSGLARVAALLGAKGLLDERHPASLGVYIGGFTADDDVRQAVEQAESLVVVGAVFSDLVTGMFTHDLDLTRAVVLDLHQARVGLAEFPGVELADAVAALADLVDRAGRAPLPAPAASPVPSTAEPGPLTQAGLWAALQDWLPPHTALLADAGTAYYGAAGLALPEGTELIGQPIWSSIGYTLPALLGVQLAEPARRPVLLIGDGAAQLTVQEFATLARRHPAPVVLVLNNAGYTVERAIRSPDAVYQDITPWAWPELLRALGGEGVRTATVRTGEQLRTALADSAPDRVTVIEAVLDRDDVPPLLGAIARGLSATRS